MFTNIEVAINNFIVANGGREPSVILINETAWNQFRETIFLHSGLIIRLFNEAPDDCSFTVRKIPVRRCINVSYDSGIEVY